MKQQFQIIEGVLIQRRVRLVLAALAISVVGDGAAKVALLLRVHDSGAGAAGLAVMLVLFALPLVLLAGVAGALADRRNPRPVLVGAAAVQLIAAAALAARTDLVSTGVGVLVLQTGFALANSAWVVALPGLVEDEHVGAIVSLHHAVLGLATPVGAALGGAVVQRWGDSAPFVLDAVSFLPLLAAGLLIRPGRVRESLAARPRWRHRVLYAALPLDGIAALRNQPLLGALTAAFLPFIVALESVNAVEVFLVKDVLGGTSGQFGLSEGIAGVAAVAGALLAAAVRTTVARARAIIIALGAISVVQIAQGMAPGLIVYILLAAAVGLQLGGANALVMTLMVTATDPATRGRVVAFVGGAARSCTLIALAAGGVLGTIVGPRTAFVIVGVVGLGIAVAAGVALRPRLRVAVSV